MRNRHSSLKYNKNTLKLNVNLNASNNAREEINQIRKNIYIENSYENFDYRERVIDC